MLNKTLTVLVVTFLLLACSRESQDTNDSTSSKSPLFQKLTASETGLKFNMAGQYLMKGDPTGLYSNISAVAVGDINNDGLPDLVFSGGHENSGLFLNQGGFKFQNITRSAGIQDFGEKFSDTEGINMVDVNGDGYLDIYILKTGLTGNFSTQEFTKDGANLLFINQGDLTFKEEAAKYGLDIIGLSHTANFFDYDADNDLDVYIAQTAETGASFSFPYYEKKPRSKWLNDQFLENQNGTFVDVREKAGLPFERNIPLSVSIGDANRDGYGDIYVANDFFGRDFFYVNNGNKTFTDAHHQYFNHTAMSAMGSDFSDINNDTWPDLFVGEMMPPGHQRQKQNLVPFSIDIYNKLEETGRRQFTRNMLQLNRKGQHFTDIGLMTNVHATEWSWSSFFFDADLDGWKDLYVANGILRDMTNMDFVKNNFGEDYTLMADPDMKAKAQNYEAPEVVTPNFAFKNMNGLNFQDVSHEWNLSDKTQSRGATYADFDDDGDLDIVLHLMNDSPVLYKNLAREDGRGNYLKIKLNGSGLNTFGIGASVTIKSNGETQYRYLSNQRGFQSCPEPMIHFGVGQKQTIDTVIVMWPGGQQEILTHVDVNQTLQLVQGKNTPFIATGFKTKQKLWTRIEAPSLIHQEDKTQSFKSNRLDVQESSHEGPGIACDDLDGDSRTDIILSGARGQATKLALSSGETINLERHDNEDLGILTFDVDGDNDKDLLVCSGGSVTGEKKNYDLLYINNGSGSFKSQPLMVDLPTTSRFAVGRDIDGDGDIDLFLAGIGNSFESKNYILINDSGTFRDVTSEWSKELASTLPISSAIWTDANTDGKIDLVTVGHWMPITFYIQENKSFVITQIPNSSGWWNSILSLDIDNDGDLDYATGNHGLNSIFKASKNEPMTLSLGDFDGNGTIDPVVFKYTDGVNGPFSNRDLFMSHMPAFNKKYYNFKSYSEVTFDSFVSEDTTAIHFPATEMQSGIWVNQGEMQFEFQPFSREAQIAPVFGMSALDMNNDPWIDLFICGNSNKNHFEYGNINGLGCMTLMGQAGSQFIPKPLSIKGYPRGVVIYEKNDAIMASVSYNDDSLRTWKLQSNATILKPKEDHLILNISDGSKRAWEYSLGSGYLSQSPPIIVDMGQLAK